MSTGGGAHMMFGTGNVNVPMGQQPRMQPGQGTYMYSLYREHIHTSRHLYITSILAVYALIHEIYYSIFGT